MTAVAQDKDNKIRAAARELARQGLRPLPVKSGEKHPFDRWTKYRDSYSFIQIATKILPDHGLWTMTGRRIGFIVLDCDNDEAVQLWRERIGEPFDRTARSRGRKGVHTWWAVDPDGPEIKSFTHKNDPEAIERGALYDLQAEGRGVMLPPSRHPDDPAVVYRWEILLDAAVAAPDWLQMSPADRAASAGGTAGMGETGTAKTGRSIMSHLLLNPPEGEGERNNWHARLAGHFVKLMPYLDAYEALAIALNAALPQPDDEDEVLKTWRWRWDAEREAREAEIGSPESAWLSGSGTELFTTVRIPTGKENYVLDRRPWANADVLAIGVIDSESSGRTYVVRVQRKDGLVHNDLVQPGMLGSANRTNEWLAKHGVSVLAPKLEEGGKTGHVGQRLLRYLEWQRPDAFRAVLHLGWHADIGFVTHEGVITARGMRDHEAIMPDPWLRDIAPYHYGMADMATAKDVLREVLTFQDETVAAVFGAWWVACVLKGQIVDRWGHFPYFMINAASEAGKTRGFFRLMLALSGSTEFGVGTKASVRDYIGSHRNGILHIDDPDDVEHLAELLRAAAGEATISKKGQDNRSTVKIKMVAPILLSGESLGLSEEKAHRDRSISVDVPTPVGRMSRHDPARPQIDDIMELERRYPNLTEFAGSLVQSALQQDSMLRQLSTLRGPAGRYNEIKAILRLGARVLHGMLHDPAEEGGYDAGWIVGRVDDWCIGQQDLGQANTLLTRILPWALHHREWRHLGSAVGNPPAYIDREGQIWCHVERLAAEWQTEMRRRGLHDRLSNESAIRAQLRAIGVVHTVPKWIVSKKDRSLDPGAEKRGRYCLVPPEYAELILGERPEPEGEGAPAPKSPAATRGRPRPKEGPQGATDEPAGDATGGAVTDYSMPSRW